MLLLKVAVLYHDLGFTRVYKNHEEVGIEIAQAGITRVRFYRKEIDIIAGMIMATKIPQNPKTQLERIIADADLGISWAATILKPLVKRCSRR